jgi:hypothetical protein
MEPQPTQWEYCQLVFIGARMPTSHPGPHLMTPSEAPSHRAPPHLPPEATVPEPAEAHYYLELVYAGPQGMVTTRQLARFEEPRAANPLYEAIGMLGGAGWELVAMEPTRDFAWSVDDREVVPYSAGLRPVGRVAHFKRRVVPGRRVDEPAIELRQK